MPQLLYHLCFCGISQFRRERSSMSYDHLSISGCFCQSLTVKELDGSVVSKIQSERWPTSPRSHLAKHHKEYFHFSKGNTPKKNRSPRRDLRLSFTLYFA